MPKNQNVDDTEPPASSKSFYGFEPLPHRGPAVTNALIDKLREADLEIGGLP